MIRRPTFDSAALERGCQRRLPADRRAQCGRPWDRIRTRTDGAYRWPMRRFRIPHLERAVSHDLVGVLIRHVGRRIPGPHPLLRGATAVPATTPALQLDGTGRAVAGGAPRHGDGACGTTLADWSSPSGKRGWRGSAGVTSGLRRSRLGPACTGSRDPGSPDESLCAAGPMGWWGSPRHANSIRRKRLFEQELGLDGLAYAARMISVDLGRQTW